MYPTIIICTFFELGVLECIVPGTLQSWVQIPNVTAVNDGWVCTWECQGTPSWQTPAQHNAGCCAVTHNEGLLWLQELHFSASKGTQMAVTSSTAAILNKSSNQLWVSVPVLLGSQKNWHLLGIKHRPFSKNRAVLLVLKLIFKG